MNAKRTVLLLGASVLFLAGCVQSINAVYLPENLTFDQKLLGVWTQQDSANRWDVQKYDESSYRVIYTDEEGRQGRFIAHLANVDGTLLLDLFPEKGEPSTIGFLQFHQIPIHSIYLVKQTEPNIVLAAIDFRWLDEQLKPSGSGVEFITVDGRKIISASTEELQRFLVEHKDRFTNDIRLNRVP